MGINFIKIFKKLSIIIYDILGLKLIWEKIHPPINDKGEQEPRTFIIWLLGIYISLFGLASSRYEQILSRLENQVNFIISQTDSANWRSLSNEIPILQQTKIPTAPTITNPISVITSFFHFFDETDKQTVNELQAVIYRKKDDLSNHNFSNLILANQVDLINSDIVGKSFKIHAIKKRSFTKAKFEGTILDKADLENVNFYKSNFKGAVLSNTNMKNCDLSDTNLNEAILMKADLKGANLLHSSMNNTILEEANLENSILIGVNLTETHDLSSAKLKGALYNSKALELRDIPRDDVIKSFCEANKLGINCSKFITNHISSIYDIATKFPTDFDPQANGMVDVFEIIKNTLK
jgi:uncharacterized protein YjbI with pentapeptide repeats